MLTLSQHQEKLLLTGRTARPTWLRAVALDPVMVIDTVMLEHLSRFQLRLGEQIVHQIPLIQRDVSSKGPKPSNHSFTSCFFSQNGTLRNVACFIWTPHMRGMFGFVQSTLKP